MSLADLDGDSDLEIIVGNMLGDDVSVLSNIGDGTYAAAVHYAVGENPRALMIGDIDGNGNLDIAVANSALYDSGATGDISVLLNDGGGLFAPEIRYAKGRNTHSAAIGDLDGDGDLDIALANVRITDTAYDHVSTLLNIGDGVFAEETRYSVGLRPQGVACDDLDGDGNRDMVVANSDSTTASVLFNDGSGEFSPATDYSVGYGPTSVALVDLDGDADLDMAVTTGDNDVDVLVNDGHGAFTLAFRHPVGFSPVSIASGDLDSDGDRDLVVANWKRFDGRSWVSVLINAGDGSILDTIDCTVGDNPLDVILGDFDGDGDLDIATANEQSADTSILFNSGNGTFAPQVRYEVAGNPQSIAQNDIDGDGDVDIVVAARSQFGIDDSVSVLRNHGDGTFASEDRYPAGGSPACLRMGDLDGDGYSDIAVANARTNEIGVLLNDGEGGFACLDSFAVGRKPRYVVLSDLDGDGREDMATANDESHDVSVLLNLGRYPEPCNLADISVPLGQLDLSDIIGFVGAFLSQHSSADLDGDGLLDLADVVAFVIAFTSGCP